MALFQPLPNTGNFGDAFMQGAATSQGIFDSLMSNKLKHAQAQREQKMAELPFGGANVPGAAGQVVGLEMIRQLYGVTSPQYQMAEKAFQLSQSSEGSRINYQNALTGSLPLRYTTPEGKGFIEQSNVSQGASPAGTPGGQSVVPGAPPYKSPYGTPEEASNQYELERTKHNVPATTLNKSLMGSNAEQTLQNIDVNALTGYSGIMGAGKLLRDTTKAQMGMASPEFTKYQQALTNANLLAKQYRQMMGDSITPTNQEALNFLTNPTSWVLHPNVAKAKFNTFAETLKRENNMFKSATQNVSAYTGKQPHKNVDQMGRHELVAQSTKDQQNIDALQPGQSYVVGSAGQAGAQPITKAHVTEENILETMKAMGMTREQVMKRLKEKGLA